MHIFNIANSHTLKPCLPSSKLEFRTYGNYINVTYLDSFPLSSIYATA